MEKMNNKQPAKKTNHSSNKKVFDVMRPGKALASPTSRPVVTNPKSVPDDQFMPGRKMLASDPEDKHELMDSKKRVAVKPVISEETSSVKEVPESKEKAPDTPSTDEHQAFGAPILDKAALSVLTEEVKDKPSVKEENASEPSSDIDAKLLLEQLAVEQVVEAPAEDDTYSRNASMPTDGTEVPPAVQENSAKGSHAKTIDELLAETGAPQLDATPISNKPQVSYHKKGHSFFVVLLAIIIGAVVGLAILNFLLDAELIDAAKDWPHTDWL